MKLKTFTMVQTQDLINDLNQYWKLCAEVTEIARFRIEEGFNAHTRDYVWNWRSPFTRRVKTIEDMTYNLCGGQFRKIHTPFIAEKGFTEALSCWFGDANPKYHFAQDAYNDIVVAAGRVGNWKKSDIFKFHELLEQYAEHPLVPNESDIDIIKTVHSRLVLLNSFLDAYKNAI